MTQPPLRRYCLIATVQGDDPAALRFTLRELLAWLEERGDPPAPGDSIHACPDRSWIAQLEHRPEVTPARYQEALGRYVAETKLASFEPKPLGFCSRCEAAVFSGSRHLQHEGKLLCGACSKSLV